MDQPNQGGDQDERFPAPPVQDGGNFFGWLESHLLADDIPDSIWDEAGHGDLTGSLDEFIALNFDDLQTGNFGNQSVAGTEQPALAAPEFADNENQTLSSHDKGLMEQNCDQFIADTLNMVQLPTMPSGQRDASCSIDQFSPLPPSRAQLPGNQKPSGIQQLSMQEQLDEAAPEKQRLEKKRAAGRRYCEREREKKQKLKDENEVKDQLLNALRAQIQILEDQLQKEQQLREKYTKVEAEKEYWKEQYRRLSESSESTSREENQLRPKVEAMEKQIKNLRKLCIEKPKKKLKKQVMMANDN